MLVHTEANDMMSAAIHEAAHLVVLGVFGGFGTARIFPTGTDNPCHERTWVGQVSIYAPPNSLDRFKDASWSGYARASEVVYMAGTAAEAWSSGTDNADGLFDHLCMADEWGEFSETDRAGFDCVLYRDAEVLAEVFECHWNQIISEADMMVRLATESAEQEAA